MSLYIFVDRLALARMDHVVLVHAALAGRFGGLAMSRRFTVIENGVFAGEGATAPDALDPRIAEFCGQRPILGAVGRLSTEKDHATLVEAFGLLIASGLDARLVIIGEGPERPRLEALAQRLGVSDRVLLPGFVPSARAYMPLFDVFVLPSLTEGLPLTLLEAMLAGTPVIATPVGGVPHTLEDGDSGLIVPPGDPDALERALRRMLAGPDFARGLAARARRQVETRFTGAVMVQRYVDLYERLLALARHHGDES